MDMCLDRITSRRRLVSLLQLLQLVVVLAGRTRAETLPRGTSHSDNVIVGSRAKEEFPASRSQRPSTSISSAWLSPSSWNIKGAVSPSQRREEKKKSLDDTTGDLGSRKFDRWIKLIAEGLDREKSSLLGMLMKKEDFPTIENGSKVDRDGNFRALDEGRYFDENDEKSLTVFNDEDGAVFPFLEWIIAIKNEKKKFMNSYDNERIATREKLFEKYIYEKPKLLKLITIKATIEIKKLINLISILGEHNCTNKKFNNLSRNFYDNINDETDFSKNFTFENDDKTINNNKLKQYRELINFIRISKHDKYIGKKFEKLIHDLKYNTKDCILLKNFTNSIESGKNELKLIAVRQKRNILEIKNQKIDRKLKNTNKKKPPFHNRNFKQTRKSFSFSPQNFGMHLPQNYSIMSFEIPVVPISWPFLTPFNYSGFKFNNNFFNCCKNNPTNLESDNVKERKSMHDFNENKLKHEMHNKNKSNKKMYTTPGFVDDQNDYIEDDENNQQVSIDDKYKRCKELNRSHAIRLDKEKKKGQKTPESSVTAERIDGMNLPR